jgi:hypothetical protein
MTLRCPVRRDLPRPAASKRCDHLVVDCEDLVLVADLTDPAVAILVGRVEVGS